MDFLFECLNAISLAVQNGKEYFVYYSMDGNFIVSHQYDREWLFRAYPGGRKVFSREGAALAGLKPTSALGGD